MAASSLRHLLLLLGTLDHLSMTGLSKAQATFICSSLNTGASFSPVYAQFQSQGLCAGTCSGYAYAILQGFQCWCSNFTPASTVDASTCDTGCPGFGTDNCGGQLTGAYAYYQLAQASGVAGGSSSSSQIATSSSTDDTTAGGGRSSTSSTNTRTSSSTNGQTRATPIVITSTAPGQVTVFVTQTPGVNTLTRSTTTGSRSAGASTTAGANEAQSAGGGGGNGFFDNAGKVAGTFVAIGLVVLASIIALIWFLRKRKAQRREESATPGGVGPFVDRKTSQSSSTTGNALMSQNGRSRSGSMMAVGEKQNGRLTPRDAGWPDDIIPVDQRLNPRPLLMRFDSNYSRHSLRDEEDYSRRVLTVTNPSED